MKIFFSCLLFLTFCIPQAYCWDDILNDVDTQSASSSFARSNNFSNNSQKELAVGLVTIAIPNKPPIPLGTAWAVKKNLLATNAHVVEGILDTLQKLKEMNIEGATPYFLPNKSNNQSYEIVDVTTHPGYQNIPVNAYGKPPVNNPDLGVLEINGQLSHILTLATQDELKELKAGQAVQYIGFPMENLIGGNINLHSLIATTQSGTISAMSDWWLGDSGQEKNWLIRHDMGATGGASGSPIFNSAGHVIGLINAGNIIGQVSKTKDGIKVTRAPSAAMVNFGIRVDLLTEIME